MFIRKLVRKNNSFMYSLIKLFGSVIGVAFRDWVLMQVGDA